MKIGATFLLIFFFFFFPHLDLFGLWHIGFVFSTLLRSACRVRVSLVLGFGLRFHTFSFFKVEEIWLGLSISFIVSQDNLWNQMGAVLMKG